MTKTVRRVAVAVAATLAAAGCSPSTHDTPPAAITTTAVASAATWDPCTQVTDDQIRQLGLDPATKDPDTAGAQYPGWKTCSWTRAGARYGLGVLSTNTRTLDQQVRHDPDNSDIVEITIGDRKMLQYHFGHDDRSMDCNIALGTASNGVVFLSVNGSSVTQWPKPVCEIARQAATVLLPVLPK